MPKPWVCKGIAKDQQSHDNQNPAGPHEPYENFGDDCVLCNLTREQVIGDGTAGGSVPVKPIALGAAALLLLGGSGWFAFTGDWFAFNEPCPDSQVESPSGEGCVDKPEPSPCPDGQVKSPSGEECVQPDRPVDPDNRYSWEPERFAWGQQTLFPGVGNQLRDQGIEAFQREDYAEASNLFKRAVEGNRNDPESLIFYNNAISRQEGDPLRLAVVVPVDNRQNSAKEMLRGVAQAQDELNSRDGINGRLVEIVIANDGNEPEIAAQVAEALSDDPTVLGVIGHNSSSASKAALEIYERAGLAMISPTSTSTDLQGDVFFRTVPSDAAAGETLANYTSNSLGITKATVFYNPEDSYSNSLQAAFETRFTALGGDVFSIDMTAPDLNAGIEVATNVSKDNAEAILLFPDTAYTSVAIELARATAQLGNDQLRLLAGDSLYSIDTLTGGGKSVEGLVVAIPWFATSPESADFAASGERRWNGAVNWRTAMSYDATKVFLAALSENASRDSVLTNLKSITLSDAETSGEAFQFTEDGERQSEPLLVEVRLYENNPPGSEYGYNLVEDAF
ncbi:amino acid/amide ABC transporter substrate-binding protein, HAAT family [Leptolyngbya sp. PCC 7375]|nr:amino acid/amide ABC transporter substrate-binding protein, HAAT family [Leptolyngbya sp. PCC 7375]